MLNFTTSFHVHWLSNAKLFLTELTINTIIINFLTRLYKYQKFTQSIKKVKVSFYN